MLSVQPGHASGLFDVVDTDLNRIWSALLTVPEMVISVVRLHPDNQFRFVEASTSGAMFLTCPIDEVRGRTLDECLIPEVRDFFEEKLRTCLRSGEPHSYERAVDLPGGRRAWVTNVIPILEESGEIERIVQLGCFVPPVMHSSGIDERNQALVDGLNATSPGIICLYDPGATRAQFVGGQAEALLGYTPYLIEEMADPMRELVHPDDYERVAEHVAATVSHPSHEVAVIECKMRQITGEYRTLSWHYRVLDLNEDGTTRTLIAVGSDVTAQRSLKREVQSLSDRLSTAQMDERRIIAQELHDSAGQYIVAAELALLGAQEQEPAIAENLVLSKALGEVMDCLKDAEREIRVLSYLLHPPAIGGQGLATMLRNFALGFGGRAGVSIDVSIDNKVNRAPEHLAIPILRVCQEALTNVHRHAKASAVTVKIDVTQEAVELIIADDGVGFDPVKVGSDMRWGIGLSGMCERVERLGGSLEIASDNGTRLTAIMPLEPTL